MALATTLQLHPDSALELLKRRGVQIERLEPVTRTVKGLAIARFLNAMDERGFRASVSIHWNKYCPGATDRTIVGIRITVGKIGDHGFMLPNPFIAATNEQGLMETLNSIEEWIR